MKARHAHDRSLSTADLDVGTFGAWAGWLALLGTLAAGCGRTPSGPIEVSITGEEAVVDGLIYKQAPVAGTLVFVDGWTVKFSRYLTVISNIRLAQPGSDPGQQQIVGPTVAESRSPMVVDLVKGLSVPLTRFSEQLDGQPFDTTTRYAFSFDVVPYSTLAMQKNLTADAATTAALALMQQRGYSTYLEGEATHAPYDPGDPAIFQSFPTRVRFQLGFGQEVSYLNCSNPDNGGDEAANRGIQPRQDGVATAKIAMHVEHTFWDKLNVENPSLRFDPLAARSVVTQQGGELVGALDMDALMGVPVSALVDRNNQPVLDRGSVAGYVRKPGPLAYDTNGTPGVSTLRAFAIFSSQAMAHLNGEGLCYVSRR